MSLLNLSIPIVVPIKSNVELNGNGYEMRETYCTGILVRVSVCINKKEILNDNAELLYFLGNFL